MFDRFIKSLAPAAAALLAASATAGCDALDISVGDGDAVPLAELDMSGRAPTQIVLAGPDNVIVTEGDTLDILVEGNAEAVDAVRFSRSDDTLSISRKNVSSKSPEATVRVTMPLPQSVTLAGSGTIDVPGMTKKAEATIAGSGKARIAGLDAETFDVMIAGSGSLEAEGETERLDLTLAGSGKAPMGKLQADKADVTIAGSGKAGFASDGTVDASIMGSGTVDISGNARCEVSTMGSGKLRCTGGTATAAKDASAKEASAAPDARTAPKTTPTPQAASGSALAEAELRAAQAEARAARAEADAARAEADALRARTSGTRGVSGE